MKRITLTSVLVLFTSFVSVSNAQSFIKWNNALGIGIGYTKLYQDFSSQYEGISAPSDLIHFDLTIYGIYAGIDVMVKDTGYEVYGFNEKLSTWALKFGPSLRLGKGNKWRYTATPYAGVAFYSLFDGSNNDIGARDEYGSKESKFIGGCKLAAIYDWYYFSLHGSNREVGFSIGVEFEL